MSADRPGPRPRYTSMQDYLRVVRRHRLLIAVITVAFTAAALVFSLSQEKKYDASSQVSFRDPLEGLPFLESASPSFEAPNVRAAANAAQITSPTVTAAVARELELPPEELVGAVSTQVGVTTNLVSIDATATEPQLAADIANAYAAQTRKSVTRQQEQRLEEARKAITRRLEEAEEGKNLPGISGFRVFALQQQLSDVESAIGVVEPVRIATPATPPSEQTSPRPKRNTAIGFVLGLVFGLAAAFLRDALDRRLHGVREIHEEVGYPILGRVSAGAFGYPGLVSPDGRATMLNTDFEGFRGLRMNLGALSQDGVAPRSVLVTSGLPEEGKSTVSMSLASAAAVGGQRVLLVECDLRRPSFARRMGVNKAPGLTDYLTGTAQPNDVLQTVQLRPPHSADADAEGGDEQHRLICITAGTSVANPAELLVGERFKVFLEKVASAYDLVVIDSSPLLAVVDPLEILPLADAVLLCFRSRQTNRDEARAVRAALNNIRGRPTGAVVTGLKRGDPDSYDYYYGY